MPDKSPNPDCQEEIAETKSSRVYHKQCKIMLPEASGPTIQA